MPAINHIFILNHLEHILFQRLIVLVRKSHLFSCIFQPLHLLKFFLCILCLCQPKTKKKFNFFENEFSLNQFAFDPLENPFILYLNTFIISEHLYICIISFEDLTKSSDFHIISNRSGA